MHLVGSSLVADSDQEIDHVQMAHVSMPTSNLSTESALANLTGRVHFAPKLSIKLDDKNVYILGWNIFFHF